MKRWAYKQQVPLSEPVGAMPAVSGRTVAGAREGADKRRGEESAWRGGRLKIHSQSGVQIVTIPALFCTLSRVLPFTTGQSENLLQSYVDLTS